MCIKAVGSHQQAADPLVATRSAPAWRHHLYYGCCRPELFTKAVFLSNHLGQRALYSHSYSRRDGTRLCIRRNSTQSATRSTETRHASSSTSLSLLFLTRAASACLYSSSASLVLLSFGTPPLLCLCFLSFFQDVLPNPITVCLNLVSGFIFLMLMSMHPLPVSWLKSWLVFATINTMRIKTAVRENNLWVSTYFCHIFTVSMHLFCQIPAADTLHLWCWSILRNKHGVLAWPSKKG